MPQHPFFKRLRAPEDGPFQRWLSTLNHRPRTVWYPSAGDDLKDMLWIPARERTRQLEPNTSPNSHALRIPAPREPQLFIHSDYRTWGDGEELFLDGSDVLFEDGKTRIDVLQREELPKLELPLDAELVHFADPVAAFNRVIYLELKITSNILGEYFPKLIYTVNENTVFAEHVLLPTKALIDYLVHVRYGGGLGGGGSSRGEWLSCLFEALETECYICSADHHNDHSHPIIPARYPNIAAAGRHAVETGCDYHYGHRFATVDDSSWSNYGAVSFFELSNRRRHRPRLHVRQPAS